MENPTTEFFLNHTVNSNFFTQVTFLVHFSNGKSYYIDIDAFKKRNFETMVYHFKTTYNPEKPKRIDMEPISLNRMLIESEIKYWPTKFEMAGLVWVIRKIRHMIETAKTDKTTVISTDHTVNISITKQTSFASNNIDKRFNIKCRVGKKISYQMFCRGYFPVMDQLNYRGKAQPFN